MNNFLGVGLMVVLTDPFRGMGGAKELRGDATVGPPPKVWTEVKFQTIEGDRMV